MANESVPPWCVCLLQCPIKDTSLNCFRAVEDDQAATECQEPIRRRVGEPHGLVKVLVAMYNRTADITRHSMTVCAGHFVALVSTSEQKASKQRLNHLLRIP